jgi:hypothetical protein
MKEVLLEDVHLEGRARFRGNQKQRVRPVDRAVDRADLSRIGGIDDVEVRTIFGAANDRAHHLRRETRTAHPEQHHVGHAFGFDLVRECDEPIETLPLRRQGQPSQPAIFVGTDHTDGSRSQMRRTTACWRNEAMRSRTRTRGFREAVGQIDAGMVCLAGLSPALPKVTNALRTELLRASCLRGCA